MQADGVFCKKCRGKEEKKKNHGRKIKQKGNTE